MRDYIILNGVNSNTISGLLISTLPSISKPKIRTQTEEIDGRDGDIITKLGYSAYDKEFAIGLYGNFDINEVIEYFNSEGTVVFSNENDKYYNYQILEQIDFEKLIRFKTAKVKMHVQPFKYPTEETPVEIEYQYVTGEGTNITLDNTDNALMQLELNPSELTQETTTGKNLFNSSNSIWTGNSAGKVNYDSTNDTFTFHRDSGSDYLVANESIKLKANTNYTLYINAISNTMTSDLMYINSSANLTGDNNRTLLTAGQTGIVRKNLLTGNLDMNYDLWLYCNSTGTLKAQIMLVEGVNDTSSYEPYTGGIPSPNPDYPSEVQVIKGNNSIKIENKNLFDKDNTTILQCYFDGSHTSLTSASTNTTTYCKVMPNTTYNVSKLRSIRSFIGTTQTLPDINTTVSNILNIGSGDYDGITRVNGTITTGENDNYIVINYSNTNTETGDIPNNILDSIQIEKGTVATDYEPHQEQVLPLNLPNGMEYCKIGTYEDEFEHDGDKWYLNKYIGKDVLDGSENWISHIYGTNSYSLQDVLTFNFDDTQIQLISNYFKGVSNADRTIGDNITYTISSREFVIRNTTFTSLSDFKTWLSTHNVEVYYVLETPTYEEITDTTLISQLNAIEKALSYDGQTNISQTNTGLPFIISANALEKGSNTATVNNTGNIYSKPTIDIEGSGTVDIYLNNNQMFSVDLSNSNECVIDTTNLEAYNPSNSALMNRQVTGDYSNFKLNTGENAVKVNGNVTKVTITDYTRWL